MARMLLLTLGLLYLTQSNAEDYYSDFADEYRRKFAAALNESTPDKRFNSENPTCPGSFDYQTGYSGCPIYDKNGRMVVFEGPGVTRKDAETYVERYNNAH